MCLPHGEVAATPAEAKANVEQVNHAFILLCSDPNVSAILVNIFGGIMKCDVIARGIINAAREIKLTVPLGIRIQGTSVEKAAKSLAPAGLL